MQGRAVAHAIEQAIRDQLAATDQPRAALQTIADELFAALDNVSAIAASPQEDEALDMVRRQFREAIAKVWEEYGGGNAPPQPRATERPMRHLTAGNMGDPAELRLDRSC